MNGGADPDRWHDVGCRPAGPRPERPVLIEGFWRAIRTGITGRAQVDGCRGDTSLRTEHVQTWSLQSDVRILWRMLVKGFGHDDAS